jgi:hypothetical protein
VRRGGAGDASKCSLSRPQFVAQAAGGAAACRRRRKRPVANGCDKSLASDRGGMENAGGEG